MQFAVGVGARVHPGAEHGADRAPELRLGVEREGLAGFLLHHVEIGLDHALPVIRGEGGVFHHAGFELGLLDDVLEAVMIDPHDHAAIHLDEAAIGVPGEAGVPGHVGEALDGGIVEAEVEDGVHHAGHADPGAGADGDQERLVLVPEGKPHGGFDAGEGGAGLGLEFGRVGVVVVVIGRADFGGEGEARRHRQSDAGHFGEVGPFAAEQIAHVGAAFVVAGTERVDPLMSHRLKSPWLR